MLHTPPVLLFSSLDTAMSTGYSCPFSWVLLLQWPPSQLRYQSSPGAKLCWLLWSPFRTKAEPCLLRYMKDAPSLALILHLSRWIPSQWHSPDCSADIVGRSYAPGQSSMLVSQASKRHWVCVSSWQETHFKALQGSLWITSPLD